MEDDSLILKEYTGAGILPYCIKPGIDGHRELLFLMHRTFEGKKGNVLFPKSTLFTLQGMNNLLFSIE